MLKLSDFAVFQAIAHAINETDATLLVTSAELLPKIVGVSRQCSSLNALVYLPRVNKKKELTDLTQFRQRFKHVYSLIELETKCESPFGEFVLKLFFDYVVHHI